MPPKNLPMLPQNKTGYIKYKQWKYKKPFPDLYKLTAKALMLLDKQGIPLNETLDERRKLVFKKMYNLAELTQRHDEELNFLIAKLEILKKKSALNPYEAKVMITELLWGRQFLMSGNQKVEAIKFYEDDLREAYIQARDICNPIENKNPNLPVYIRINTLTISIEDTLNAFYKEGWNLLPRCNSYSEYLSVLQRLGERDFIRDYHISELLAFPPGTLFYNHPGYIKGKFLYQDKGSCLSSFLLNPKPDSVVFDACAAPGIKTNHLANIMNNTGLIYANDIHPLRVKKMIDLLGLTETNARILKEDFISMDYSAYADVKYILVEPSSTYSGIFYAVGARMKKVGLMRRQFVSNTMLRSALQQFPNVKRVVYTICSLYSEEGEEIIEQVMKEVGDSFTLLDIKKMLWNEWESMSQPGNICGGKCLRIVPEYDLCQGYFVAVFERNFDVPIPPYSKKLRRAGAVYDINELEKVKTVNPRGRVVEKLIPKNKAPIIEQLIKKQHAKTIKNKNQKMNKKFRQQREQRFILHKNTNVATSSATINNTNTPPVCNEEMHTITQSQLYP
ncbi:probable 28S rRNA (cytosine-C(5))-methyltransferase isoform X1 [Nasonia vitripennis]|uniref:SAM-dependent MTase RsmB/NOP-type domain-containing protein n=2 Tax=Nasonia vitripennis TaxID=7425 RepID=A0A7M7IU23_NASVI|nr:probable 28S rRNA (cytosine-C(5))-methyltransferase isoform X1 [Nasonia vitripennis]XP_016844882.1 probable 28S rRNA (cytosine-C(5))-methyltransferase isoform X1 [Nasonia vitripennis]XP_016844883.1 probable 28S rRNA (cytosine-C(5))-methyltransferase isoform X1 [Nasonia vitripennis]